MSKRILTAEDIASRTEHLDGISNIRAINRLYRDQDESHLYPINGDFDATERAIRRARAFRQEGGEVLGLEYCYLMEQILSDIVNSY